MSPSESNSVYEKAAEGVIPAKRTLVRGYHSKTVLYVEYSTGGAFDSPTQNTIGAALSPQLRTQRIFLAPV